MFYKSLIASFFILLSVQAHATVIDKGWYTEDTEGLYWLDVTATKGMSFNDVYAELSVGGLFDGWRYATIAEIVDLTYHYTGILATGNQTIYYDNEIDGLISLLGPTFNYTDGYSHLTGFVSVPLSFHSRITSLMVDAGENVNYNDKTEAHYHQSLKAWIEYESVGSFLVRDTFPIPEPSIIALFSLGLIGFGFIRRKDF